MNEKIKKLAEQSGFYFYDLHDIGGEDLGETIEADSWEAAEKFAELIIEECLGVTLDYKNVDYYSGWIEYRDAIRKHFGIEE